MNHVVTTYVIYEVNIMLFTKMRKRGLLHSAPPPVRPTATLAANPAIGSR